MNKKDLIKAVAGDCDRSERDVVEVIDSFLKVVSLSLSTGESVNVRDFGKFEERTRKAVTRRNPATGDPIDIPERRTVAFIPGDGLRERLNQ